jgi:hypothetical protein
VCVCVCVCDGFDDNMKVNETCLTPFAAFACTHKRHPPRHPHQRRKSTGGRQPHQAIGQAGALRDVREAALEGLIEGAALLVLRQRLGGRAEAGEEEDEGEERGGGGGAGALFATNTMFLSLLLPLLRPLIPQPQARQGMLERVYAGCAGGGGGEAEAAPELRADDEEEVGVPPQEVVGAVLGSDGFWLVDGKRFCTLEYFILGHAPPDTKSQ